MELESTSLIHGIMAKKHTDSKGYAYFEGYPEGEVKVSVNGMNYGKYLYLNGKKVIITL